MFRGVHFRYFMHINEVHGLSLSFLPSILLFILVSHHFCNQYQYLLFCSCLPTALLEYRSAHYRTSMYALRKKAPPLYHINYMIVTLKITFALKNQLYHKLVLIKVVSFGKSKTIWLVSLMLTDTNPFWPLKSSSVLYCTQTLRMVLLTQLCMCELTS